MQSAEINVVLHGATHNTSLHGNTRLATAIEAEELS